MSFHNLLDDFDDQEDLALLPRIKNMPPQRKKKDRQIHKPRRDEHQLIHNLVEESSEEIFNPTYHAKLHEREWILTSLTGFFDQRWLNDVVRLVQGGKEASVYLCAANPGFEAPYIAAKIYRPRRFRQLKNDFLYREGRSDLDDHGNVIQDDGMLHAIRKRTEYGRELLHTSWIEHEHQTMRILHSAGVDLPKPYIAGDNAILMEYIGDEDAAAPLLNSIKLPQDEARKLFDRVIWNVETMLAHNRIHGDLSAYNILYFDGKITLIDFPQAIDPDINRNAFNIFERDVRRVCEYFARQGVYTRPRKLAVDLWISYNRRLTPDVHPGLLNAEDDADVAYWKRLQE
jgi:RIO kinase 1